MKLISSERYDQLIKTESESKHNLNEALRKEFTIQRQQKKLDTIKKLVSKLNKSVKKERLIKVISEINKMLS